MAVGRSLGFDRGLKEWYLSFTSLALIRTCILIVQIKSNSTGPFFYLFHISFQVIILSGQLSFLSHLPRFSFFDAHEPDLEQK